MTNMDPWDRASNLKPKTTWSMNFKNLINGPRDQIYERAREGSQETNQGDFASMDAFMQVQFFVDVLFVLGQGG